MKERAKYPISYNTDTEKSGTDILCIPKQCVSRHLSCHLAVEYSAVWEQNFIYSASLNPAADICINKPVTDL